MIVKHITGRTLNQIEEFRMTLKKMTLKTKLRRDVTLAHRGRARNGDADPSSLSLDDDVIDEVTDVKDEGTFPKE
jgi:hypothetical protein